MNNQPPSIGKTLKSLRVHYGYKQDYVAYHLGITRGAYSHYENDRRTPDPGILLALSDLYQIPVDTLLRIHRE